MSSMDRSGATWSVGHGKGPKVRVCYVCGRGYGLSSYDIHLKQCKAMWDAQQQGLPPSERKPLPREPEIYKQEAGGTKRLLDAQNEAATQVFNTDALDTCEHCGRTFLTDRLKVHQKSCTASSPAKAFSSARLPFTGNICSPSPLMSRPQTASHTGNIGTNKSQGHSASSTTGHCSSDVGPRYILPGTHEHGPPLAGNYGGIARRGNRGSFASPVFASQSNASELSALETLEMRVVHIEQELAETKKDVKELLDTVKTLQSRT